MTEGFFLGILNSLEAMLPIRRLVMGFAASRRNAAMWVLLVTGSALMLGGGQSQRDVAPAAAAAEAWYVVP